jgi:photosystem II stability/assembly factor-like uncharacterized protein
MLKRSLALFLIATSATLAFAAERKDHQPKLTPQNSGTTQLLISVSPVNSRVVWAAGPGGTFVTTTDGGENWKAGVVPGAEALQFRDVQGVSDKVAYLMSIGSNTTDFRIYKTVDGGATWTIEFTNQTQNAFYDCFAFWTPHRGIAHSDSVDNDGGLAHAFHTQEAGALPFSRSLREGGVLADIVALAQKTEKPGTFRLCHKFLLFIS